MLGTEGEDELAIASILAGAVTVTSLLVQQQIKRAGEKRKRRFIEEDLQQMPLYRPPIQYIQFEFSLDSWTDVNAEEYFRFNKTEIRLMVQLFEMDNLVYPDRCTASGELALCITLCRLSSTCRYKDLFHHFGRSRTWQSNVFNAVICYLFERYKDSEKLKWDVQRLDLACLRAYCLAIKNSGGPDCVWGFVDGTLRPICRPTHEQRRYYTGYKKAHALKWQAIMAPDGLICSLDGPYEGRLGDWSVWQSSKLEQVLRNLYQPNEEILYLYGDPAYTLSYAIMGSYRATVGRPLLQIEKDQNAAMASFRICVEHGFGKVISLWRFVSFKNGLKIEESPVGAYYGIAVLLTNIHTCFRGSQTSLQFNLNPPSVEEYLYL